MRCFRHTENGKPNPHQATEHLWSPFAICCPPADVAGVGGRLAGITQSHQLRETFHVSLGGQYSHQQRGTNLGTAAGERPLEKTVCCC